MRFAPLLVSLLVVAAWPLPSAAQKAERPSGWKVRFDRPAPDTAIEFVTMEPGWHITTGPAAILYNPATTASGNFRVASEIALFPSPRREAFGIFVGGQNLEAGNQSYLYFLIRGDGQFLVKRRAGADTQQLIPWTANEAVVAQDGGEGTAKNVLAIDAGADQVRFLVNGTEVASLPRDQLDVDGVVGLRINHRLDVHVTKLQVEKKN